MPMPYPNQVLASLNDQDLAALEPHLMRVDLEKGQVLSEQEHHLEAV